MRTKDQVRRGVWKAMDQEGVSRFPGAEGRIPNFAGSEEAARQLAATPEFQRAHVVKVNPDAPQRFLRAEDVSAVLQSAERMWNAIAD